MKISKFCLKCKKLLVIGKNWNLDRKKQDFDVCTNCCGTWINAWEINNDK